MIFEKVKIENLYFDPDNLRYDFDFDFDPVPIENIAKNIHQNRVFKLLIGDVKDLIKSIMSNDFIYIERVVVKKIDSETYYVIEGNRRLAALKYIFDTEDVDSLKPGLQEIFNNGLEVGVVESDEYDIDILMGMRHVTGVKHWSGFSKAKLVVKMKDIKGFTFKEISHKLGGSVGELKKNYQTFKLLEYMEEEGYNTEDVKNYYALVNEALKKPQFREWLQWNEETNRLDNPTNAERFFSWIAGNEDSDGEQVPPIISNPQMMREVAKILDDEDALEILEETKSIVEATRSSLRVRHKDVKKAINSIYRSLSNINIRELQTMDSETKGTFYDIHNLIKANIDVLDTDDS